MAAHVQPGSVPKAGERTIEGVTYVADFLDGHADFLDGHEGLFTWALASVAWDERIQARKTASYGLPYDYAGLTYVACPFPPELERARAAAAAQIGEAFNNCLLNYYPDGRSRMGFHADSAEGITAGTGVAILSLGAQRNLRFRRSAQPDDRLDYVLAPGSLLYMRPEVQDGWQHSIPRSTCREGRVSLTFRVLSRP